MKGVAFLDGRLYTKTQAYEFWGNKFQNFRKFIKDIHNVFTAFHPNYTFVTPLISFEGKDAVFLIDTNRIFMMRFIDELTFDLYYFVGFPLGINLSRVYKDTYFFYYDDDVIYLASKAETSSYLLILDPKSGARIYRDNPGRNAITAFTPIVIEGKVQGFFLFDLYMSCYNPPKVHVSKFVKYHRTFAYDSSFIATYTDRKTSSRTYSQYHLTAAHPTVLMINKNLTLFTLSQGSFFAYLDASHFSSGLYCPRLDTYAHFNEHIEKSFDLMIYGDMIEEAWIIDPLCSIADFSKLLEVEKFKILQSPLHLTKGRVPLKRRMLPKMKEIATNVISLKMEKVASVKLERTLSPSPISRVPTMDNLIPFVWII